MSKYNSLDAVHIASHGNVGQLFLGSTVLESDTLVKYADELTNWGNSIAEDGDILLYGCNVATDLTGAAFVEDLSQYTQADIQASNDLTGNSLLGGNWDLEYATGNIEANLGFSQDVLQAYQHSLYYSPTLSFDSTFLPYIDDFYVDSDLLGDFYNEPYLLDYNYELDQTLNSINNINLPNFDISTIDFTPANFDFEFVNVESNRITFSFTDDLDFSGITASDLVDNSAFFQTDGTVDISNILSFDADKVTFTSSSVTFEYDATSLQYNADIFRANAHLFDYKFLDNPEFSSITDTDFSFDQFNASDYRALEYAFAGDELFDPEYYLAHNATPVGLTA